MKKYIFKKSVTEKELKDISDKFYSIEPMEARLKDLERRKDVAIEDVKNLKDSIKKAKKEIFEVLKEDVT